MVAVAITSADMAEKKSKTEDTEQIGLRLNASLLKRMRTYANSDAHGFRKPSLTSLMNEAMKLWLEQNERDIAKPPRPPR